MNIRYVQIYETHTKKNSSTLKEWIGHQGLIKYALATFVSSIISIKYPIVAVTVSRAGNIAFTCLRPSGIDVTIFILIGTEGGILPVLLYAQTQAQHLNIVHNACTISEN